MSKHRDQSPLYRCWALMRYRCNTATCKQYPRYGGRGITVCARWDSYEAFEQDMGPHPGCGLTLERKKVHRGYYKRNCTWASRKAQARNRAFGHRSGRLTAPAVVAMRKRYAQGGITQEALAKRYGVTQSMVSRTVNLRSWQ